jgi:hypothetical protein
MNKTKSILLKKKCICNKKKKHNVLLIGPLKASSVYRKILLVFCYIFRQQFLSISGQCQSLKGGLLPLIHKRSINKMYK